MQVDMFDPAFHPAVADWFEASFSGPTPCQRRAWRSLAAGRHTLIAAPTGSGKTLAGFLMAIDSLVRQAQKGPLPEGTQVEKLGEQDVDGLLWFNVREPGGLEGWSASTFMVQAP